MKLNEVGWNVTLTPIYLQRSEAVGGNCNILVHLMSITFVAVFLRFVNYLDGLKLAASPPALMAA